MSPRKVGDFRLGGGWAFCVVAKNLPVGKSGHDVNSATGIAAGSAQSKLLVTARPTGTFRKQGFLTDKPGDCHLKAFLKRSDGARGLGEGGDEMAQGHGVGLAVGFARRRGNQPQTGADKAGEIMPSGEPATGGAQRECQRRCLPRGVAGSFGRATLKKLEKLAGPQRAIGNDVVPMNRKCASAA
jgi:hypothetical protein